MNCTSQYAVLFLKEIRLVMVLNHLIITKQTCIATVNKRNARTNKSITRFRRSRQRRIALRVAWEKKKIDSRICFRICFRRSKYDAPVTVRSRVKPQLGIL
jgi:hypothetical protein